MVSNNKIFKLGLDLHGVTDKAPEFFSLITKLLVEAGHQVHIMTGEHKSPLLEKQIKDCDVAYTHLFSIADWHKEKGTQMVYDSDGNPWMDSKTWDKSKADYAHENALDLVIDDTTRYGTYFQQTIFMAADIQLPSDKAQRWLKHRRQGMEIAAKNKTWIQKDRDLYRDGFPNVVGFLVEDRQKEALSFQKIVDISFEKGIDLYKVFHEQHGNSVDTLFYHFFLTEPFSDAEEWKMAIQFFQEKKDRRFWKL